jgi:hypothetical protein
MENKQPSSKERCMVRGIPVSVCDHCTIERLRGQLDAAEQHVKILQESVAAFEPPAATAREVVAKFIMNELGERCSDFNKGCLTCAMWEVFDQTKWPAQQPKSDGFWVKWDDVAPQPACGHVGKVQIPTATMEQEFQTHYRRGYEAGKRHAQPSKPSEWQPIETAPVEMGPILMTDGEWFAAGHVYDEDSPRQYRIHHFAVTQEYNWTPTHWMAIPALAVPTKGASNG